MKQRTPYTKFFKETDDSSGEFKTLVTVKRKKTSGPDDKHPSWDVFAIHKDTQYPQENFVIKIARARRDTRPYDDGRSKVSYGSVRVFIYEWDMDGIKILFETFGGPWDFNFRSPFKWGKLNKDVIIGAIVKDLNSFAEINHLAVEFTA